MKRIEKIREKLGQYKPELRRNFLVKEIGIFGSYIRGEEKKGSDLDILVEFEEAPSLFKFIQLEHYLGRVLKVKVDLVMKDALKPVIGERIMHEVIYS
ncbi:MAG: nucleotidyltransferase family protein [Candidatus Omnitrophica bacterium]|nr:nucleotidyltransferase family protein [Candidatus Omnitrophota bacterium]